MYRDLTADIERVLLTEEQIKANREMLKSKGYTEEQIDEIFKLGIQNLKKRKNLYVNELLKMD